MQTVSVSAASVLGARRSGGGPRWILDLVTDDDHTVRSFSVRVPTSVRSAPDRADGAFGASRGA